MASPSPRQLPRERLIVALGSLDTPIEYVFTNSRRRAAKVLKVDIAMSRLDPVATVRMDQMVQSECCPSRREIRVVDAGSPGRHGERHGRRHIRPATVFLSVGGLVTLVTMGLCISNNVTTLQAIALALAATVTTLGGWIGLLIPDALAAWRRGFKQGCLVALEYQASGPPDNVPPSPNGSTVTDLLARSGPRHGRRTRAPESY
jgi:hypothetical protein